MNDKGASILAGRNSRLDEIQAAFILNQLKFLTKDIQKRRKIAEIYKKGLNSLIQKPNENLNSNIFIHITDM